MKRVVIGVKNGQPYVVSKQGKVEVIFRTEKKRTFRKTLRTWAYNVRAKIGML